MSRWGPAALASGVDLDRLKKTLETGALLMRAAQEKPTDQRFVPPPGTEQWLGDIVISLQRARVQAKAAQHDLEAELRLLAVHGFLHLLGYDHAEPKEERAMTALATRILDAA